LANPIKVRSSSSLRPQFSEEKRITSEL